MAPGNRLLLPVVSYVAVSYVLYSMKPQSMFDSTGTPRPFGLNSDSGQTPLPFWLLALGVALFVHHVHSGTRYTPLAF